jgi:hypothetical protein
MKIQNQIIMFIIMFFVGIFFNPMNILAFRFSDLYFSLTLIYGGLLMASNMIWAHEIFHYFSHNKFCITTFIIGLISSFIISVILLREQFLVDDNQWLKRMISHHSTALTSSTKILNKTQNQKIKKLAQSIIQTQENEIKLMKNLIK